MNPQVISIIKQAIYRLPDWATSVLAVIFGLMVALNVVTFESLMVFFSQPFVDWFAEVFNLLMGSLIAAGGIAYDPRAEPAPTLLVDEVKE